MANKKTKKVVKKDKIVKTIKNQKRTIDEARLIISRVQLDKEEMKFSVSLDDASVAENIIKDAELEYERINLITKVNFILFPNEENYDEEEFDINELDILSDEMLEPGQCFQ